MSKQMERLAFEAEFRTIERMVKRGNIMIEDAAGEFEMTGEEFLGKKRNMSKKRSTKGMSKK